MKKWLLPVLFATTVGHTAAWGSTNALLDHLTGQWVLTGTLAGKKTTHDVSAEWVLNHGYVRLHEISREKAPHGGPAYEAIIFVMFDSASDEYSCLWLDSTAASFSPDGIGRAKIGQTDTNAIPFLFKDAGGHVNFENTFRYDAKANSWEWTLANVQDEKRKPFGHVRLVKK